MSDLVKRVRALINDTRGVYANHRERALEAALSEAADRLEKLERVAESLRAVKRCEGRGDVMAMGNAWQDVDDYLADLDAEGGGT